MSNTKQNPTNIYYALCEYEEILTERVNVDSAIYKDCLYDDEQRLDDVGHYLDWLHDYITDTSCDYKTVILKYPVFRETEV